MRMIKIYKWDCIIRWGVAGLIIFFGVLSNDFLDLLPYAYPVISGFFTMLFYLIPVHPIFWLLSLIFSIKNKQKAQIIFSIIAPIVSILFFLMLVIFHAVYAGNHGA